jgi:uncharacterized membrane protein YjdF
MALIIAAILAIFNGRWSTLFASVGTLCLTLVPQALASKARFRLPLQFEMAITVFLFATLFLGENDNYYYRFAWWDVVLHGGSAFAFGFAGFLILYLLVIRGKLQASPFLIAIFSFTFALAIGAMWEIFEFTMDTNFGTNMQKSGLRDTMGDLIVDASAAAIASAIGYFNLRFKNVHDPFDALVAWFLEVNPRFKPLRRTVQSRKVAARSVQRVKPKVSTR